MMNGLGSLRRGGRSLAQLIGLFCLCLFLTVSCGGGSSTDSATSTDSSDNGRITLGTTLTVRTVDPADTYEIFPGILLYNLGDRLYTYEPGTTDIVPQLATEMPQISDDGLTYTIPLRDDVTFHDGSPFNAEAMVFSIQRFMENGGRPAYLLSDKIASVEASGDYEITIQLSAPFAGFPSLLAFSGVTPVPPSAYEIGPGSFQPSSFIGTGPYKLSQIGADLVRLDVNEDYWGEAPANNGLDIQIFSSPANLFNAFRTNTVDIAYQTLDPDQISSLVREAETNNWQVEEAGSTVINYLVLNQKMEPYDNLDVRKAIASLIDRPLLNERVFQGQAEPLYSILPTSFSEYEPVFQEAYGDGDAEKAKAFLESAGFSESNPLPLEIWYISTSTTDGLAASTLEASIEQQVPGLVDVTLQGVESATAFENLGDGIYPTFILNWYPDFYDVDTFIHPFLHCDEGSEETGCTSGQTQAGGSFYYSDRVIDLVNQQRLESDVDARRAIIAELQQSLIEDVPYVPLWQKKDYAFSQPSVDGFSIQPTQQVLFWQLSKS
ncbi:MAG: peptide ABC transporter substrate-binding protein [Synechococcales cyanobacterium K44_A2020_017]|nr:peptide ABC transporter substrate-binding protein [Synechococcales cyanobacterium K32_A2020_035]MBF2095990.1 peptide ABC transporter substrate-binding protein [Synechococcales cyanobacterium K44_A2020_017]